MEGDEDVSIVKFGDTVEIMGTAWTVTSKPGVNMSKLRERLGAVEAVAATAWHLADQQTLNALADCERSLRRIITRAEVTEGMERIEIAQMHGPTVEFTGRMVCTTKFAERRGDRYVTLELYETQGGALVAVTAFELGEGGQESERAVVVPPIADVQAMRFAVMEAFTWHTEAKKMVRKKLGWDLRCEVR